MASPSEIDRRESPPKVVRIIARLNIGGPARHVSILQRGLPARGFSPVLVYGRPESSEGSLEDLIGGDDGRAVHLRRLGRSIRPWDDAVALAQLLRIIVREQPAIVHTHTAKAGMLGRLAAALYNATRTRDKRCVVVHTFHGHVLSGYFGAAASAAVRVVERTLAKLTDRIVALSEGQRRELADRFAVAPFAKITVLPLGLNLEPLLALPGRSAAAKESFGLSADAFVFGYVGRFAPVKDLPTLVAAFAMVARRMPSVRLLLVGEGETMGAVRAAAHQHGVQDLIRFAGWQLDLARVYSALDVVVLTSRNEGTPVALIEAMAAGLPVVATSVGGVPDIVAHGEAGLLTPPGDATAAANAMARVASDPEFRARAGAEGRKAAERRFSADALVGSIADLYTSELNAKRRPQS